MTGPRPARPGTTGANSVAAVLAAIIAAASRTADPGPPR